MLGCITGHETTFICICLFNRHTHTHIYMVVVKVERAISTDTIVRLYCVAVL